MLALTSLRLFLERCVFFFGTSNQSMTSYNKQVRDMLTKVNKSYRSRNRAFISDATRLAREVSVY